MIVCIGEILADMIGKEENGVVRFSRYVGGAPFNVACDLKKLGVKAGFVGCVGEDLIGRFLSEHVEKCGFDHVALRRDALHNTTLAFVELDAFGERKFSFYRKNTADYHIAEEDVQPAVTAAGIVHLGSLMLSEDTGRKLADKVVACAKAQKRLLSFDVNYREDIFQSTDVALAVYKKYIEQADIVKFSEDELLLFTGADDLAQALELMKKEDRLTFVTLGKKGSAAVYRGKVCYAESIPVKVVDTTGAGDAFYAGVLSKLDGVTLSGVTEEWLRETLRFGNICGALTASGYGAVDACPSGDAVEALIENCGEA